MERALREWKGKPVRYADTASWRFSHDISTVLHAVLYVRDALGLSETNTENIPRLADGPVERSGLLTERDRLDASRGWPGWWARSVAAEYAELAKGLPLADPPEWSSLADHPGLQRAARLLFADGCAWAENARRPYLPPESGPFDGPLVSESAEAEAATHNVSVEAIDGRAQVLLVEGTWWKLTSPGLVLCSIGAATDPGRVKAILHTVFSSALSS